MKKHMKKLISLILALCLGISALLGTGAAFKTDRASAASDYTSELWMLEDCEHVLMNGEKIYIGPSVYAYEGGNAYMPLSAVAMYMGAEYTVSGSSVTVTLSGGTVVNMTVDSNSWSKGGVAQADLLLPPVLKAGEVFISVLTCQDVFSAFVFNHITMGLIVVSKNSISYDKSYNSMKSQISILGALLFDRPKAATIGADFDSATGAGQHPRLLADQDRFDKLRSSLQNPDENLTVYGWLVSYNQKGAEVFNSYFDTDGKDTVVWKSTEAKNSLRQPYYLYNEAGERLVGVSTYEYTNDDGTKTLLECGGTGKGEGYDEGGRSNVAELTSKLKCLAFTWQMTGEKKYADAFYLLGKEIGKWEHWGEGHFLNCADGAVEFALGLDWIYHAFDSEPEKRDELASILYNKGLMKGYYSIKNDTSKLVKSSMFSGGWKITNRTNNWQTVCGSGMIVSALYLLDYSEYRDNCLFVTETLLETLEKCLIQYAPDGSYIESPGYWAYGTNAYFIMLAALESALGTDYGYYDTVGLRKSCYFAHHITDSDFYSWNFHDGSRSIINRSAFYLASRAYGDPEIAYMRDTMLFDRQLSADILDILFYDPSLSEGAAGQTALDRNHLGIDTVTMRSGWESGSIFTGLHVGANEVSHGDYDSGTFYLEMGGVLWVGDPGKENYNVGGYFGSQRGYYYRKALESHNTVLIRSSSLPHGQVINDQKKSYAKITQYHTDENGAYAVADMRPQYGETCSSAKRGLLLTNSRSTVVLQDEITFSTPTDLTWIAAVNNVYEISEDGRTAYARGNVNGKRVILRITLISEDEELGFELLRDQTILPGTVTKNNSGNKKASNPENRLIIAKDGATEFNVSVVFEIMRDPAEIVAYEAIPMAQWQTSDDEWVKAANDHIVYPEDIIPPKYKASDFAKANNALKNAKTLSEMGRIILDTFVYTTDFDKNNSLAVREAEKYMKYVEEYNRRVNEINEAFSSL